jgi:hypothetical protein
MMRHPSRCLCLELLEDRTVPATFGNAWIDPLHLTVSFAPDGTAVGTQSSQLSSFLGQSFTPTAWRTALLQAVQAWASSANINVGLVADAGTAFGSSAQVQGDPMTGDIRFGAVSLSTNEVAEAFPFQALIGSWSGDILFNTNEPIGNGTNGTFDLYTVALHEVGHALGLDHNPDINSAMYEAYQGVRTGLSTSDVTSIQSLYGARQQDAYDQAGSNDTPGQATVLNLGSPLLPKALTLQADITTPTDVDYYRFTAPTLGLTSISLKTAGISLLTGDLTVYDSNMRVVGEISNSDPLSANALTLSLALRPGQQYSIGVRATAGSTFNVGAYQLAITPLGTLQPLPSSSTQPERLLNDTPATATPLTSTNGLGYSAIGTLVLGDVDYYRLTVSAAASKDGVVSLGVTPLLGIGPVLGIGATPRVELYNAAGTLLPGKIVGNENGTYTIEVQGQWQAGDTLYVKVFGAGLVNAGGYGLSVNFLANPTALQTMVNTTLSSSTPQVYQQFTATETELFHLVLSASGTQAAASVQVTIQNAQGQVVGTLWAQAGNTVSTNIWLTPGAYTFTYSASTSDGSALLPLGVRLEVADLSDPIDPYAVDTTSSPSQPQPQPQPQPQQPPANSPPPQSSSSTTTTNPQPSNPPQQSSYTYSSTSTQPQRQSASSDPSSSPYNNPYWY